MNCEKWDEEIALWAGGDTVGAELLAHLDGCRRCRAELAAMKAAMRQWTEWTPTARPLPTRWWLGVAAAVVPLLLWVSWPQPVGVEQLVLTMPKTPSAPVNEPAIAMKQMRQVKREKAVTVKIFTDDPNVVILLLGDAE